MAKYVWCVWQSMLQFRLLQSMFVVQFNSSSVAFSSLVKYVWFLRLCCCCVALVLMLLVIHVDIYMLSVIHDLNMIMHRTHLTSLRMITDNLNAWFVFLEDSMDQINSLQFAAQGHPPGSGQLLPHLRHSPWTSSSHHVRVQLRSLLLVHAWRGAGRHHSPCVRGVHLPPPTLCPSPQCVDALITLPMAPLEA
jgi:hypothetical protein